MNAKLDCAFKLKHPVDQSSVEQERFISIFSAHACILVVILDFGLHQHSMPNIWRDHTMNKTARICFGDFLFFKENTFGLIIARNSEQAYRVVPWDGRRWRWWWRFTNVYAYESMWQTTGGTHHLLEIICAWSCFSCYLWSSMLSMVMCGMQWCSYRLTQNDWHISSSLSHILVFTTIFR